MKSKPYAHINWKNATRAGLFTNAGIDALSSDYQRTVRAFKAEPQPPSPKGKRITVQNATPAELLNAAHKIKMRLK